MAKTNTDYRIPTMKFEEGARGETFGKDAQGRHRIDGQDYLRIGGTELVSVDDFIHHPEKIQTPGFNKIGLRDRQEWVAIAYRRVWGHVPIVAVASETYTNRILASASPADAGIKTKKTY